MEAVRVLRELWQRRLTVAIGIAVALVVAILMAYRVIPGLPPIFESRQYTVGVASAELLVDSPSSQVADLGGGQGLTDVTALTARARLLANLMAASPLKDQIARAAGIDPRTFVARAPSPTQRTATVDSGAPGPRANVMTVYFNETLPIVTADAQAVSEAVAARISGAAVIELGRYLKSVAALDEVPDARQLVVDALGQPRSATVQRGPSRLLSVFAFALVLGLWCTGVIVVARLARGWRAIASGEDAAPLTRAPPVSVGADGEDPPPPSEPTQRRRPPAGSGGGAADDEPGRLRELPVPPLPERPERPARRNRVA